MTTVNDSPDHFIVLHAYSYKQLKSVTMMANVMMAEYYNEEGGRYPARVLIKERKND